MRENERNPLAGYDQWKTASPPDDEEDEATCPECGFSFAKAHCVLGDEGENYHAWCLTLRLRRQIDNLTAERDEARREALETAARRLEQMAKAINDKYLGIPHHGADTCALREGAEAIRNLMEADK
jgi:hypothetical protein